MVTSDLLEFLRARRTRIAIYLYGGEEDVHDNSGNLYWAALTGTVRAATVAIETIARNGDPVPGLSLPNPCSNGRSRMDWLRLLACLDFCLDG